MASDAWGIAGPVACRGACFRSSCQVIGLGAGPISSVTSAGSASSGPETGCATEAEAALLDDNLHLRPRVEVETGLIVS